MTYVIELHWVGGTGYCSNQDRGEEGRESRGEERRESRREEGGG